MPPARPLVRLAEPRDAAAIAEIYNQGIRERSSTFETKLRSAEDMIRRLEENPARYPVLVADEGRVQGWSGISAYRPRDCYAGIGEFSVYIDAAHRGRGLGRRLVNELVNTARERGYWKLLSRVFSSNVPSLALCRATGFREVGVYEKHGRLDGRWIDVVIVERLIPENQPE